MELKKYQARVLEQLSRWFVLLEKNDWKPSVAWEDFEHDAAPHPHILRKDSSKRSIPHICLKVPTGGGKTLLAAESLARFHRRTGLVLWMVPNRAIYDQTKKALWTRDHPYRLVLERASGGRVKVLEKDDNFSRNDIDHYLCIMLVSLQAANKVNSKEFLRMYRESERYSDFFPDVDDNLRTSKFLDTYPGLDTVKSSGLKREETNPRIKHTLANVFKVCRPIIILDEAHKAYGSGRDRLEVVLNQWVNRFDPFLVLELSATPDIERSNVLVEVSGLDLKEEEMIKLPIEVTAHGDASWQHILMVVQAELEELHDKSSLIENRHIRPMVVVRVSRTGLNQRDSKRLHAEDVREHLTKNLGLPDDEVRIQSSDTKELNGIDLMSEDCRVKWIITKDALKEGWDCSNAYILVLLDNTSAKITVTQMLGRVLRQPQGKLTEIPELDRCYIHCGNTDVDTAVEHTKRELEQEGFSNLQGFIVHTGLDKAIETKRATRRVQYASEMARLPQVLYRDGSELDYEKHILYQIKWDDIVAPSVWGDLKPVLDTMSSYVNIVRDGMSVGTIDTQLTMPPDREYFDLEWYTRQMLHKVPNPWKAATLMREAKDYLEQQGRDQSWIHKHRSDFLGTILRDIERQVDEQAETLFKTKLKEGDIKFDMDIPFEFKDWYEVPTVPGDPGLAYEKSLFSPVYGRDMNTIERRYALFLDQDKSIRWWHRIAAQVTEDYRLQGWRKDYVYPDFVALKLNDRILVHETKGNHLAGNEDTIYKQRLLRCLQEHFNSSGIISIHGKTMTADFTIVFEDEIQASRA